MLKARRMNRVVRIADEKASEYRALGYTITKMDGTVVAEPNDDKHRIQQLEKENADLKAQLAAVQEAKKPASKTAKKS